MELDEALQRVIEHTHTLSLDAHVRAYVSPSTAESLIGQTLNLFDVPATGQKLFFGEALGAEWYIDHAVADGDIRFEDFANA